MPTDVRNGRTAPSERARTRACAAALAIAAAAAAPARGHEPLLPPDGVATVVLNVARFTQWPEAAFHDASEPLRLCVSPDCPLRAALTDLDGAVIGGRRVAIVPHAEPWDAPCHVAFVSDIDGRARRAAEGAGAAILVISDAPDFAAHGGAVGVIGTDDGVGFEVNVGALRRAGLGMSSRLLRLARSVGP